MTSAGSRKRRRFGAHLPAIHVPSFRPTSLHRYRTQWLTTIPDGPDKTFYTHGAHEVHLVESWESPDAFPSTVGNKTRDVHAYSSAPSVELLVNGKSVGTRPVVPMLQGAGSYAEFLAVPWEAGNLTAVARDASGKPVASTSRTTNGKASALTLTLDAPSKLTGTGDALFLDGSDVALLRATVVDSVGHRVVLASTNISFRILSGPGYFQGAHNGDPHNHHPNNAPWVVAWHGLARGFVRVTSTAGRPARERELLRQIDTIGPMSIHALPEHGSAEPIVVEASADGFAPVKLSIPTSTDPSAAVLAVAEASAGKPVDFFAADRT
jgi:hypothetical protein